MWFPSMWHFDKCRPRRACAASFNFRSSKSCSVSSLTLVEYSSDEQRLWSDCAYAQADLRLCWSPIPHCWKSHATAHWARIWDLYANDSFKHLRWRIKSKVWSEFSYTLFFCVRIWRLCAVAGTFVARKCYRYQNCIYGHILSIIQHLYTPSL